MNEIKDVKPNIRGFKIERCDVCKVPKITCICGMAPEIKNKAVFCILMNEKEPSKPTNTGKLISDSMSNTKVFIWSRVDIDNEIIKLITDEKYKPYVIFPDDRPELKGKAIEFDKDSNKIPLFILLDGTWKQARKIYKKSEYLQNLPLLSLNPDKISEYTLRRASEDNHLCTVEVAVELLKIAGEEEASKSLYDYFKTFTYQYLLGKNKVYLWK